jgi:hypothetical protein
MDAISSGRLAPSSSDPDEARAPPRADNRVPFDRSDPMVIAADYPFLDVLWTMIIFFTWVIWIWIMVVILTDVFLRRDIGGWTKALWTIFLIVFPFLAALIYLIKQHDGLQQRQLERAGTFSAAAARSSAGPSDGVDQIHKAQELLEKGAITQAEFDTIKAKALSYI